MGDWLSILHGCLRWSHIAAGSCGLILFWVVVFSAKGTAVHRQIGRLYVWTVGFVAGTGLLSSVWALCNVHTFAPWISRIPVGEQAERIRQHQFLFSILFFLSMTTIAGALSGLNAIRNRSKMVTQQSKLPLIFQVSSTLSGVGLCVLGGYQLILGQAVQGFPQALFWIPAVLGCFGIMDGIKEIRFLLQPTRDPQSLLYKHIEQMFGTGIAFHTAFLVFGANRLIGVQPEGPLALLPWILPLSIGGVAANWYINRLKRSHTGSASGSVERVVS